jgi:hypothetical protein
MNQSIVKLSTDQQSDIVRALHTIDQLLIVTDDLQACGEDCQLRKTRLENLKRHLSELLARFSG